ncbi:MAG: 5-oxoprolinase subunit PxpC [Kluyvera sp.]|uniref:5-oxoprolinase subunit PxpC n=1 Tax=Kluyvera sp. TaxID=1538228 RepID=UPI003A8B2521
MLEIIRAGMSTTLQDGGRHGMRQSGISRCGAMDSAALRIANLLVGNAADSAVLEITLGQCAFVFHRDGWFALAGADCAATLDGKPVWSGWRWPVRAGQRLKLALPKRGMRSYLAVSGGFDVPSVMGSYSTDLKAGFGGFAGRSLQEGDRLPLRPATREFRQPRGVRQLQWGNRVRALPGPEYHEFSAAAHESFWRAPWKLSPQSNRMGYRMQGQVLERTESREMFSHGLLPGVVQVPHNGQPIVLMNDAQTTGGYPRIACVIEADMYHLAQIRLGETVHFERCTLEEALAARAQQQRYFEQLEWRLNDED